MAKEKVAAVTIVDGFPPSYLALLVRHRLVGQGSTPFKIILDTRFSEVVGRGAGRPDLHLFEAHLAPHLGLDPLALAYSLFQSVIASGFS